MSIIKNGVFRGTLDEICITFDIKKVELAKKLSVERQQLNNWRDPDSKIFEYDIESKTLSVITKSREKTLNSYKNIDLGAPLASL